MFQPYSIGAHCTVGTTAPPASTLHEFMEKGKWATLTVLVSISPWQLKADLKVFLQYT